MAYDWRRPVVDFTALVTLVCFAAALIVYTAARIYSLLF